MTTTMQTQTVITTCRQCFVISEAQWDGTSPLACSKCGGRLLTCRKNVGIQQSGTAWTLDALRTEAAAAGEQAQDHKHGLHWSHWNEALTCPDRAEVAIEESAAHAADLAELLTRAENATGGDAR